MSRKSRDSTPDPDLDPASLRRPGYTPATPDFADDPENEPALPPALAASGRHPWERRDDESELCYSYFLRFRDMGIPRSVAKLAQQLGRSPHTTMRYSSDYDWATRVRAWDARERGRDVDLVQRMEQVVLAGVEAREKRVREGDDPFDGDAKALTNFAATTAQLKRARAAMGPEPTAERPTGNCRDEGGCVHINDTSALTLVELQLFAYLRDRMLGEAPPVPSGRLTPLEAFVALELLSKLVGRPASASVRYLWPDLSAAYPTEIVTSSLQSDARLLSMGKASAA